MLDLTHSEGRKIVSSMFDLQAMVAIMETRTNWSMQVRKQLSRHQNAISVASWVTGELASHEQTRYSDNSWRKHDTCSPA